MTTSKPPAADKINLEDSRDMDLLQKTFRKATPYFELMRLDRFNGYWYFWCPHVFGTLLAAISQNSSVQHLLRANFILTWGVLIMRGATCTWNDTLDVDFDRQVSRCRSRPLARGAVSLTHANLFTAAQTIICLATLKLLPPLCFLYTVPAILGWMLYPLAKRFTYYPQVALGFPMAWGVYVGAAAMGSDPLGLSQLHEVLAATFFYHGSSSRRDFRLAGLRSAASEARIDWTIAFFYLANVFWTLLYELVYSHQDAAEDEKAGVRNLVLLYVNHNAKTPTERYGTKPLLNRLAIVQALSLTVSGFSGVFGLPYFVISVLGSSLALIAMLASVQLERPESCAWFFKVGNLRYTGGAMLCGLLFEYIFG